MRIYLRPKLLVIDEVGYIPLDGLGSNLFFQLISARYEKGSIILTSSKGFGEWGSSWETRCLPLQCWIGYYTMPI